jgi:hypothetical protein
MRTTGRLHTWFIAATFVSVATGDAGAQTDTTDEIRRELAQLRSEVLQLRVELDALRGNGRGGPPRMQAVRAPGEALGPAPAQAPDAAVSQPSLELLQTQLTELAQVKVESTSKMPVKVFGTIHTNLFLNSGNPNWLDSPNLVNVPPADGSNGSFSANLRQTRLGFTVDGPTLASFRTTGAVALDFFGGIPGFATGQVMGLPRLLVAFARMENDKTAVEIGQDHMILAPLDPTSLASFAFPALFRSGNLYLRAPQVRVEHALPLGLRLSGGIVAPIGGDVPGEDYRFVPQAFGGERSRRPAFQARMAFATGEPDAVRHVNLGVSSHYAWERRGALLAESSATAVDFSIRRDYVGVAGELFSGTNIDAFGGALGLDARARGGWAEIQLFPTQRLTIAAGAGVDDIRGDGGLSLVRRRNRSAYGVGLFSLTPEIQASFEYHWLATLPGTGTERPNQHLDWVLAYKF